MRALWLDGEEADALAQSLEDVLNDLTDAIDCDFFEDPVDVASVEKQRETIDAIFTKLCALTAEKG